VERVFKEMETTGLTPEGLLSASGLDKSEFIHVLNGDHVHAPNLYALIDSLPGLNDFFESFNPNTAPDPYIKEKWREYASELRDLREAAGESQAEQAIRLGISENELKFIEEGDTSPSILLFRKIMEEYPGFSTTHINMSLPTLWQKIVDFVTKNKWHINTLSSKARISEKRLRLIINGSEPKTDEMKRLKILIPNLPSWKPEKQLIQNTPVKSREQSQNTFEFSLPEISSDNFLDEEKSVFSNKPDTDDVTTQVIIPDEPSEKTDFFKFLTEEERRRVSMCEDALLRLGSNDQENWRRRELFPDDTRSGKHWIYDFLEKIVASEVVERHGDNRHTRYIGIKDRVDKLISDPEWLMKLIVPSALSRVGMEEDVPEEKNVESVIPEQVTTPVQSSDGVFGSEAIFQYYQILSFQHDKIEKIEKSIGEINHKLDEILTAIKGKP